MYLSVQGGLSRNESVIRFVKQPSSPQMGVSASKFIDALSKLNLKSMFGTELLRKSLFNLADDHVFLNQGAYGASFKPSIEASNEWRLYAEQRPRKFFDDELPKLMLYLEKFFAYYMFHCDAEELALVDNVTFAFGSILKSIYLGEDHNILCFSTTYQAYKSYIDEECAARGAKAIVMDIEFPLKSERDVEEKIVLKLYNDYLTDHTIKYLLIDMVPSFPTFLMPVKRIVDLCKYKRPDIIVIVDAAHCFGSVKNFHFGDHGILSRGIDLLVTNCHKWFGAAKGTGFIFRNKTLSNDCAKFNICHLSKQLLDLKPAVRSVNIGKGFHGEFNWLGLKDYSSLLSLLTTYYVWKDLLGGVDHVVDYSQSLCQRAARHLSAKWNTDLLIDDSLCTTLACIRLPDKFVRQVVLQYLYNKPNPSSKQLSFIALLQDLDSHIKYDQAIEEIIGDELRDKYKIEVQIKMSKPGPRKSSKVYVRISASIFNYWDEYVYLGDCVVDYMDKFPNKMATSATTTTVKRPRAPAPTMSTSVTPSQTIKSDINSLSSYQKSYSSKSTYKQIVNHPLFR